MVACNRLALLQKCVSALRRQTRKPYAIVVIHHRSTNGTEAWLLQQPVFITSTQPKGGVTPGFIGGLQHGYTQGANWVWLIDDDTIPEDTVDGGVEEFKG